MRFGSPFFVEYNYTRYKRGITKIEKILLRRVFGAYTLYIRCISGIFTI